MIDWVALFKTYIIIQIAIHAVLPIAWLISGIAMRWIR